MKITTSLILVQIVMLVAGVFVINRTITLYAQDNLKKEISASHLNIAQKNIESVNEVFYERILDVVDWSRNQSFANALEAQNTPTSTPKTVAEAERSMKKAIQDNGYWKSVYLLNRQGEIIASTDNNNKKEELTELEIYNQALRGKTSYTDAILTENKKNPTQFFASPVESADGAIPGVLIAELNWQEAMNILSIDKVHRVYLLNSKGTIIGVDSKDRQHLIGKNVGDKTIVKQGSGGGNIVMTSSAIKDDFESLTAYAKETGYKDYQGKKWSLLVESPLESAFYEVREAARNLLIVAIPASGLIVIVMIFLIINLISRPLANLNLTIDKITAGDMSQRALIERDNEIGKLAEKFNTMAAELEKNKRNIEKEVDRKTEELKKINKHLTGREIKMANLKKENKRLREELRKKE
jgi:HAMP domain-containing protein